MKNMRWDSRWSIQFLQFQFHDEHYAGRQMKRDEPNRSEIFFSEIILSQVNMRTLRWNVEAAPLVHCCAINTEGHKLITALYGSFNCAVENYIVCSTEV